MLNRINIYLYKSRVTTEIDRSFQWLVAKLKSEKTTMDKTVVYCKSIKDCGRLFMFLGNMVTTLRTSLELQQTYSLACIIIPH